MSPRILVIPESLEPIFFFLHIKRLLFIILRSTWSILGAILMFPALIAQTPTPVTPVVYEADAAAVVLARNYLAGDEGARPALLEALRGMG